MLMTTKSRVAIVVNADGRTIARSATFIRSHIDAISRAFDAITLVGNPGSRRLMTSNTDIQSQTILGRGLRKLSRMLSGRSVLEQDSRTLIRLLKAQRIDAVFCEYGMSAADVLAPCRALGIPLVVHFHGYDAYRHDLVAHYHDRYKALFDYANSIIAVSKDMQATLTERYGHDHKVIHSSCGIHPRTIASMSNGVEKRKQFVYLGRLTPKKDPIGVIRCFIKAAPNMTGYRLAIVGDGELRADCEREVALQGVGDLVDFHGALDHEAALNVMVQSRFFVMNSVTAKSGDKEGTPVSLMEAMAAGLTSIGTRHGGITDIIEDGVTGYLYDEQDYNALTRLMIEVTEHEDQSIGQNARQYALDHLDESEKTALIVDRIQSAIEFQRSHSNA